MNSDLLPRLEQPKPRLCSALPPYEEYDDDDEYYLNLPPVRVEDDPTITAEHLEQLRQRSKNIDEGKCITFTKEQLFALMEAMSK